MDVIQQESGHSYFNMVTQNKSDKKYPEDYTKEQREQIKEIVIARIKLMPESFRASI